MPKMLNKSLMLEVSHLCSNKNHQPQQSTFTGAWARGSKVCFLPAVTRVESWNESSTRTTYKVANLGASWYQSDEVIFANTPQMDVKLVEAQHVNSRWIRSGRDVSWPASTSLNNASWIESHLWSWMDIQLHLARAFVRQLHWKRDAMLLVFLGVKLHRKLESVFCNTWTKGTNGSTELKYWNWQFISFIGCIEAVGRVLGIEEKFGLKCLLMASNLTKVSSTWECEKIVVDCTTWFVFRFAHLLCSNNVYPHISTRRSKVDAWWQVIWIGERIGHIIKRHFTT